MFNYFVKLGVKSCDNDVFKLYDYSASLTNYFKSFYFRIQPLTSKFKRDLTKSLIELQYTCKNLKQFNQLDLNFTCENSCLRMSVVI